MIISRRRKLSLLTFKLSHGYNVNGWPFWRFCDQWFGRINGRECRASVKRRQSDDDVGAKRGHGAVASFVTSWTGPVTGAALVRACK